MLLKTAESQYRYPDIMVVCDQEDGNDECARNNPILIVEVLSSNPRRQDKIGKRSEYIALSSLQEYILVEQDIAEIEIQRRRNQWQPEYFYLGQDIVTVSIEEVYQWVDNSDVTTYLKNKAQTVG